MSDIITDIAELSFVIRASLKDLTADELISRVMFAEGRTKAMADEIDALKEQIDELSRTARLLHWRIGEAEKGEVE